MRLLNARYRICALLGVKMTGWCRYRKSASTPGMHRFDPQETWCPGGVQANVLMLGYMLIGQKRDPEALGPVLEQVRQWAEGLRQEDHGYDPAGRQARTPRGEY